MSRSTLRAHTDTSLRAARNDSRLAEFDPFCRLFAEGDAPGGAAAAPAADAAPAATPSASAATGAAAGAPDTVIVAPAAEPSAEDQRKFLTEKGGKAEELAKLSEADLKKAYDDARAAEAKPEDKAGEVKPEDLKITLPEGVTLDEKQTNEFKALVLDTKLSPQERAQKMIDMHVAAVKGAVEQNQQAWLTLNKEWFDASKADPEFGGAKFQSMQSTIAKGLSQVLGKDADATFEALKITGGANNPAIVRAFYRLCQPYAEGTPNGDGKPAALAKGGMATAIQSMYPSAADGKPA